MQRMRGVILQNALLEKQIQELNYQLEDDQRSYEAALNDRDAAIRKMREECQALMVELQMLLDTKQTLDAEIAIYRKMLEGEENRAGLKQLVEQVVKTHAITQETDTGISIRTERCCVTENDDCRDNASREGRDGLPSVLPALRQGQRLHSRGLPRRQVRCAAEHAQSQGRGHWRVEVEETHRWKAGDRLHPA